MINLKEFILDLHMHDGAAAAGGDAGTGGEGNSPAQTSGAKPRVEYGKAEGSAPEGGDGTTAGSQAGVAAGNGGVQTQQRDLNAEFEEMIKGDYKDAYKQKMQAALDRRFKNQNDLQGQIDEMSSVLDPLMDMYGIDDYNELRTRILTDNGMFEQAAEEMGMTVDQYVTYMDNQRRVQEMEAQEQERQRELQAQSTYKDWENQAEALKEIYPEFDLQAEVDLHQQEDGSNKFIQLLGAGIDVKTAFEAMHVGELMASTAQQVGDAVRKQTTDTIKARGMRPAENGLNEQAGVIRKSDPSKLTAEDRKEIAKRARRGEVIKF